MANDILTEKIPEKNTKEEAIITEITKQPEISKTQTPIFEIFLILASILLAIFLILFISFTIINIKSKKIISGVYIKNYEISNLTQEEASKKLNDIILSQIPEEIKLKHNDFETSISTKELNIQFDTTTAINSAYKIGRTENLLKNNITILKTKINKTHIPITLTLDTDTLKKQLQDISGKLPDTVKESSYYIEGSNQRKFRCCS